MEHAQPTPARNVEKSDRGAREKGNQGETGPHRHKQGRSLPTPTQTGTFLVGFCLKTTGPPTTAQGPTLPAIHAPSNPSP